jgi:hypothetical protein
MIFVLQSSLYVGDTVKMALSINCTKGAFNILKNTSGARGAPEPQTLQVYQHVHYLASGYSSQRILRRRPPLFKPYQDTFPRLGSLLCSFYQHGL